jgi:hypothetical protein
LRVCQFRHARKEPADKLLIVCLFTTLYTVFQ